MSSNTKLLAIKTIVYEVDYEDLSDEAKDYYHDTHLESNILLNTMQNKFDIFGFESQNEHKNMAYESTEYNIMIEKDV